MELIFSGLSYKVAIVHVDDIIVFSKNIEEHLEERMEHIIERLEKRG